MSGRRGEKKGRTCSLSSFLRGRRPGRFYLTWWRGCWRYFSARSPGSLRGALGMERQDRVTQRHNPSGLARPGEILSFGCLSVFHFFPLDSWCMCDRLQSKGEAVLSPNLSKTALGILISREARELPRRRGGRSHPPTQA